MDDNLRVHSKVLLFQKGLNMDKVIRDGKVAVLYSPDYGAGWYTWNTEHPAMLYDPAVVRWVEEDKPKDDLARLEATLEEKYPRCYLGGMRDLQIEWLPVNTVFQVTEYDGFEKIEVLKDMTWQVA